MNSSSSLTLHLISAIIASNTGTTSIIILKVYTANNRMSCSKQESSFLTLASLTISLHSQLFFYSLLLQTIIFSLPPLNLRYSLQTLGGSSRSTRLKTCPCFIKDPPLKLGVLYQISTSFQSSGGRIFLNPTYLTGCELRFT